MNCKSMIITLGPPHDRPWWWNQISDLDAVEFLDYRRLSVGHATSPQMGLGDLPTLVPAIWRLLRHAKRTGIRYVFTFESDVSCFLVGLMQRIPACRGPRHVILQYITREPGTGWRSKLRVYAVRSILNSVWMFVCSSNVETDFYARVFGWRRNKLVFVPLFTDARLTRVETGETTPPYAIAAGRTHRDYRSLLMAIENTGIPTEIVCGRRGVGVDRVPQEARVTVELGYETLLERLARARVVVLPLQERRISAGQSVLLQAMSMGKPVIATRTAGTEDYLVDNVTGILVPPNNPAAIRRALHHLWSCPADRARLGSAARQAVLDRFLADHYVQEVRKAIDARLSSSQTF
jgi:glycosyltransferase involved in cell wall biosynthesis